MLRCCASICCVAILVVASFAQQGAPLPNATKAWLDANAVKVATLDINAPYDDLMPLKPMLQDVRIILLGEQTHSDGATFRAKARLVRFLHEQLGFNVLAFEAGLFESDVANDLMAQGKDVNSVMYSFLPRAWCVSEVQPVIAYVAQTKPTEHPLWLAGFDSQETGRSGDAHVRALLAFVGETVPIAPADRAALLMFGGLSTISYHPSTAVHSGIAPALERLRTGFDSARTALERQHGAEQTALYSRLLDNLQAHERQMAAYQSHGAWASNSVRDQQMADNIQWLAEVRYPHEKIICWAGTMHIVHETRTITRNGQYLYPRNDFTGDTVKEHFGDQAYAVGFAADHGRWGSPAYGQYGTVPPVTPRSINGVLHSYGQPYLFVDLHAHGPFARPLDCAVMGYTQMQANWRKVVDGIFFTDEMTPATPMK